MQLPKEQLIEILPLLIPLIIIQLLLAITAIRSILKQNAFRFGNKWLWLFIVILGQLWGPLLYFFIGRDENA